MRVCVKERKHAKESTNISKTLLEMAFFLDKKQEEKKTPLKNKGENSKKKKKKGKKARGRRNSHFISSTKCQIACLHYLERLSRINKKFLNTYRKKKYHFSRTDSNSTRRYFNKEITFLELHIKRITLQSED